MQFLNTRLGKKVHIISEKGFTLIEIITVIVLLGIVGVMGSDIITTSLKGFSETDTSMELFEEGKLALMRMEREIHHMVPNAVQIASGTDIYFGKIDINTISKNGLSGLYTHPVPPQLYIIMDEAPAPPAIDLTVGTFLSIYNTSWDTFTNTTSPLTDRHIYRVDSVNGASHMSLNDVAAGTDKPVVSTTATSRYYPVQLVIRYYLDSTVPTNQILRRSQGTVNANADFITPLTGMTGIPLLSHIDSLEFDYTPASLSRNALVRINFTLSSKGISLDFHKEIQVRNVP